MANVNLKVTVEIPAFNTNTKLAFTTYNANDVVKIGRRVPFAAITNLQDLKDSGKIRNYTQNVTTEYGGANGENDDTNFGYSLPRSEKMVLLLKTTTSDVDLVLSGNATNNLDGETISITGGAVGDIHTIDLFDLGLHTEMGKDNGGFTITPSAEVEMVLLVRSA